MTRWGTKPDKQERIAMVRAMETIARGINDEAIFEEWLEFGIPDGEITKGTADEELECYITDDVLSDLMGTFAHMMKRATKGIEGYKDALYCDGCTSN